MKKLFLILFFLSIRPLLVVGQTNLIFNGDFEYYESNYPVGIENPVIPCAWGEFERNTIPERGSFDYNNSGVDTNKTNKNTRLEFGSSPLYLPNKITTYQKFSIYAGLKFFPVVKKKSIQYFRVGMLYLQNGLKDSLNKFFGWKNIFYNVGLERVFPIKQTRFSLFIGGDLAFISGYENEGNPYPNFVSYYSENRFYGFGGYLITGAYLRISPFIQLSLESSVGIINDFYINDRIINNIKYHGKYVEFGFSSNRPIILSLSFNIK